MNLTPHDIRDQIAAVDSKLADMAERSSMLALAAAEEDQQAAQDLARLRTEMGLVEGDREILVAALTASVKRADAAADQASQESRAQHLQDAVGHLDALLDLAGQADRLVEEFQRLRAEINAKEAELLSSARGAGIDIARPRVGMRGAASYYGDTLRRHIDGTVKSNTTPRSVSDLVASGWSELQQERAQ